MNKYNEAVNISGRQMEEIGIGEGNENHTTRPS